MVLWEKAKNIFKKEVYNGASPEKLALSFSIGLFIAWSPFIGGHTIMMFASRWLFSLNFPVLIFSTFFNNPWTMVPFYSFGYAFGYWFVHELLGLNPPLVISLQKLFGAGQLCLCSFAIGGTLLGLLSAVVVYPPMYFVFKKIAERNRNTDC